MGLSMTVGEWSHRLVALVGFTTSEAIQMMKMGLRKEGTKECASKRNSQSWSTPEKVDPPDLSTCHSTLQAPPLDGSRKNSTGRHSNTSGGRIAAVTHIGLPEFSCG